MMKDIFVHKVALSFQNQQNLLEYLFYKMDSLNTEKINKFRSMIVEFLF